MRADRSKNNRRITVVVGDRESKSEVMKFLSEIKYEINKCVSPELLVSTELPVVEAISDWGLTHIEETRKRIAVKEDH